MRITAQAKGVKKTALRDALGLTDWRAINGRWKGEIDYTVSQLVIVAEVLVVPMADLIAGADESEEES